MTKWLSSIDPSWPILVIAAACLLIAGYLHLLYLLYLLKP